MVSTRRKQQSTEYAVGDVVEVSQRDVCIHWRRTTDPVCCLGLDCLIPLHCVIKLYKKFSHS
jgi:hypothetical protein